MRRVLYQASISLLLLVMAGSLFWFGYADNRIDATDLEFIQGHRPAGIFSEAWLLRGHVQYFREKNGPQSAENYRLAMAREPVMMDAWLGLARAEIVSGHEKEAARIVELVRPSLENISSWKGEEIILAFYLGDEAYFRTCFNYMLEWLPHHTQEASELASQFWGGWASVLPHLASECRAGFFKELLRVKEPDTALALWKTMEEGSAAPDDKTRLQFCQFLIAGDRMEAARSVWKGYRGEDHVGVHDGGFEHEPLNTAFGWRFGRIPDVEIKRDREVPQEGNTALKLRFLGTKNVVFSQVAQTVPVEPGKTYHLRFSRKSAKLSTDQGVFLEVAGYQCKGLRAATTPVLGTTPWTEEELEVPVPAECKAVTLTVRRKESLKMDNKISGDYWLDNVRLEPQATPSL